MYLQISISLLLFLSLLILGFFSLKRIEEDELAVIFRAGRFNRQVSGGLTFIIPFLDRLELIDCRLKSLDLGKQTFFSSDNVSLSLNVSIFYNVQDGNKALKKVEDLNTLLRQAGESVIKSVVASFSYDEILSNRQNVFSAAKSSLSKEASEWGIHIDSFKIYDFNYSSNKKASSKKSKKGEVEERKSSAKETEEEASDDFLI